MITDADIRYEFTVQLQDLLQKMQDEWHAQEVVEIAEILKEHPEHAGKSWCQPSTEFMNDAFNSGDCEWTHGNTFRFWHPQGYVLDERMLEILRKPDVVWCGPSI